jgi:hypothetical protein
MVKLKKNGSSYLVTVNRGFVCERLVKAQVGTNQIKFHEPSNLFTDGEPTEFAIEIDQSVYVEYDVSSSGEVSAVPLIVVAANDIAVTRFYPAIGEYAGQSGKFSYKLSSLIDVGGKAKLKHFLAGDNVPHIIERFSMINLQNDEGTFYKVLKNYNPDTDEVFFRSLQQLDTEGIEVISPISSASNSIAFRRVRERSDYTAQVKVSEDQDAILIQGNGVDGALVLNSCDEEADPVTLLSWEDGLITSESNSFQAGCLEAILPYGVKGDILYHDGEDWVVLNKPIAETTHVLAITGDIPYWLETEECDEPEPT